MVAALVLSVLLVGVFAVHFLAKAYGPVSMEDIAALHVLSGTPPGPVTDRLFAAYLSRARRYRTSWSVAGWLGGVVLAVALRDNSAAFGNPFVTGPIGYLGGAVVAELHHLRRRPHGVRTASLAPRRLADYVPARQQRLLRGLVVVMGAVTGIGLVLNATNRSDIRARLDLPPYVVREAKSFWIPLVLLGTLAVAVWVIVERTERAVVERPRPAMPDDLARADDAIRATSLQALALGGAGVIALLACWAVSVIANGFVDYDALHPWALLFELALFALAIRLAFRARRLAWPLRKLEVDGAPR
jgi:hypothetical protein